MREVSEKYTRLCNDQTRRFKLYVDQTGSATRRYTGSDIISADISIGQTNGGFTIGATFCAILTLKMFGDIALRDGDKLTVYVRFFDPNEPEEHADSAQLKLGTFYVDNTKHNDKDVTVTAYDKMLNYGSKYYRSTLTYPAQLSAVLGEICAKSGAVFGGDESALNNVIIAAAPRKENEHYTFREVHGSIAGLCGANAFLDADEHIKYSSPNATNVAISPQSVIRFTNDDVHYYTDSFEWLDDNRNVSREDDYNEHCVYFATPLFVAGRSAGARYLRDKLVGIAYDGGMIQKQGTGIFEIGDMINFAYKGAEYTFLISNIRYNFANGFFSETLTSKALNATQSSLQGGGSNSDGSTYVPDYSGGGNDAYLTRIDYKSDNAFDLTWKTRNSDMETTNAFEVTEDAQGRITQIRNTTIGRNVVVTYSD